MLTVRNILTRARRCARWVGSALMVALLGAGCGRPKEDPPSEVPPPPASLTREALTNGFGNSALAVVENHLSPALLIHSTSRVAQFFMPVPGDSSVPPRYVAYGSNGPKILTNGVRSDPPVLHERWVVAWYQGATQWEHVDCPVGLLLQHPPVHLKLDAQGLRIEFSQPAGDILMMPLYGTRLLPASMQDLVGAGLPREELKRYPKVWEWSQAVPRDPLTRVRYWGSALIRYPISARTLLSPDAGSPGAMRVEARFEWYPVVCDWTVPALTVAPVGPALGPWLVPPRPGVECTREAFDMDWPGVAGQLVTMSDADHYSVRFASGTPDPAAGMRRAFGRDPSTAGRWEEWPFAAGAAGGFASVLPLRLREGSRVLEIHGTNGTSAVVRSLGALGSGGTMLAEPEVQAFGANVRLTRWGAR